MHVSIHAVHYYGIDTVRLAVLEDANEVLQSEQRQVNVVGSSGLFPLRNT